jgi:predicted Zn-dependent protease
VRSPVASAAIRGRLSELWKGIRGVGTDRRIFPLQSLVAAPTLFIAKATFG